MPKTDQERKQYKRDWYLKNHARELEKRRAYFAAHQEENKVECRRRYAENKEEYRQRGQDYRHTEAGRANRRAEKKRRRERHPEKVKAENKRHRERHRGWHLAYMTAYNRKHGDRLRAMARANYYANREQRSQYGARWREANPGYDKVWRKQNPDAAKAKAVRSNQTRRARKKKATIGADRRACAARIKAIKTPDLLPCHWCEALTTKDKRHVDHVIPLSRDGPHSAENLVPACPECNCRKRNKLPHEFLATPPIPTCP